MSIRIRRPHPGFLRRAVAALALGSAACAAPAAELIVSAAASLTNAFQDIAASFTAAHPDTRVLLNFGASGALLQQIAKGAPADVFASADEQTMDQAAQQRLIDPASRADFVGNALVVIVPGDAPSVPPTLQALTGPGFRRIAIGLPASVPVGRYTQAVLEKAQLWAALQPRTIGAASVRQALDYVARGEVDAGFVYATDAAQMPGKVRVAFKVPTETPVRYPIAAVAGSANAAAAAAFIAHVQSPPARAVFEKYGFTAP